MKNHTIDNGAQRTPVVYWLLLLLPPAIHFFLLWRYAVNAPRLDDFSDALVFLPDLHAANSIADKTAVWFALYNEHRYGVGHTLYWLDSILGDGALDFRGLTIAGNLSLVGLLILLCRCVRTTPHATALCAIGSLLLFNLQGWYGMFWTTAAVNQFAVLLFALAAFMLVVRRQLPSLWLAMVAASLATLSQGNGIFVWPVAGVYLWRSTGSLRHPHCLAWWCASLCALLLYFGHFAFFTREGVTAQLTTMPALLPLAGRLLGGILALPGSWLLYPDTSPGNVTSAIAIGIVVWSALGMLLWRRALHTHPALLMWLVLVTGSIASITLFRTLPADLNQALQGHYKIYPAIMLWLIVVALSEWATRQHTGKVHSILCSSALLASALHLASLVIFLPVLQTHQQQLAEDMQHWLYTHNLQRAETRFYVPRYNEKLQRAVDSGAYNPWSLATPNETVASSAAVPTCDTAQMTASNTLQVTGHAKAQALHITGNLHVSSPKSTQTLLLCSAAGNVRAVLSADNVQTGSAGQQSIDVLVPRHNIGASEWAVFICNDCP